MQNKILKFSPLLFFLLAVYYTLPFLLKINYLGVRDWDLFTTIAAVPVGSLLEYGQFPFWNPYLGGGNILFHHPEVLVLSPFMLLYLVFGAVVGLKLQVMLCYFIGFWGSFKLFQRLGISSVGAFLSVIIYFGSVHFALHFAEGHMPFTHFCFLPWFIYFLLKSDLNKRNILYAAISLTLMILGNGAAVPFLYTVTFAGLYFFITAVEKKQFTRFFNFCIATVLAVFFSAVKFLPMVIYLWQNRWVGNQDESIPLSALGSVFFGFNQSLFVKNFSEQFWNWHEYGAYLSPLAVGLILFLLWKHARRHIVWGILLIIFLLLGLGDLGSLSPWTLLSNLPGYSSIRCSGRFFQFVLLASAVMAGFGFDLLRTSLADKKQIVKFLPHIAALAIICTNLFLVYPIMSEGFKEMPQEIHRSPVFRHIVDVKPQAYKNYLANKGSLITPWLSAYHPSRGLVGPQNKVSPEYIIKGDAIVEKRFYTQNNIEYMLNASSAGEIVFGMGYDRGWRSNTKTEPFKTNELLTMPFPKGKSEIILTYQTPYFYTGLFISLLSLLASFLFVRKDRYN